MTPTEEISLPSQGLLYPKDNPLSSGKIEMKYMTAREEDILTNSNYIKQNTVIDKLLQALIVTKIDYNQLLLCDKDAILVAARILGYGKDYEFTYFDKFSGEECVAKVNLTELQEKPIKIELFKDNKNEFSYTFNDTSNSITFKLLTHGDEQNIDAEIKGLKKINPNISQDATTRLKHIITSINGKYDSKSIRDYVDNNLLAREARELRKYYTQISPGLDLTYKPDNYAGEGITIPIGVSFLWPDSGI